MENKIVKVYVLKGKNGISLAIENYRVSNEIIYGMLTPIYTFEVATDDILQAIGQEPNQSDDCVSRKATLDAIIKELCIKDESYLLQSEKAIYNVVKNMPLATPTCKSGLHWIERFDDKDKWLECPHCHKDSDNAYAYCPNCGADMRGNENGI